MHKALRFGLSIGAILLALGTSDQARADAAGDKALATLDEALNRAKTHYFEYDVVNQEPGKGETKLGLIVRTKGEKRLTEFTAPGDMKGTKVLILGSDQTYVYLPAFKKVRRVASSVSDQGFMGMTFSTDDFLTRYSDNYNATIASDDGKAVKLVATVKQGKTMPYSKIEITLEKARQLPTEIKLYNGAGTHVKTEVRSDYTCEGNICTAKEQKMTDHTKGGHWTKLIRKTWKVNEEMSDDVFSKRNLEK